MLFVITLVIGIILFDYLAYACEHANYYAQPSPNVFPP